MKKRKGFMNLGFNKKKTIKMSLIESEYTTVRKRGAILIEFLVAIPVFMLLLWGIINIMLFMASSANLNEAADEASRMIAKEMRGYDGAIQVPAHTEGAEIQVRTIVGQTDFVRFESTGHEAVFEYEDTVIKVGESPEECIALAENENAKNFMCAYVQEFVTAGGRPLQQVVVQMRSEFKMIGSMIPGLDSLFPLQSTSISQKELPGRYNYVE